jgi:hypothetical protein
LYVGNWDEKKKLVMRYEAKADGAQAASSFRYDQRQGRGRASMGSKLISKAICTFQGGRTLGHFIGRKAPWDYHYTQASS